MGSPPNIPARPEWNNPPPILFWIYSMSLPQRDRLSPRGTHHRQGIPFAFIFFCSLWSDPPFCSWSLKPWSLVHWTSRGSRRSAGKMARRNNFAVPTLDQRPFLEEPPLYYAAIAAVFDAFGGPSDKTVRSPPPVFALCCVLGLFFPAIFLRSKTASSLHSSWQRAASILVAHGSRFCAIAPDPLRHPGPYLLHGRISERRRLRYLLWTLCYLSCTLAFYAKGFIGIAIPRPRVLSFVLFDRNIKEILRMRLWLGIVLFPSLPPLVSRPLARGRHHVPEGLSRA